MRKPLFPLLPLVMSLAALAFYAMLPKPSPRVIANASRETYTIGEPISIDYRVVNDRTNPVSALFIGRLSDEYDSRLYVSVRAANGATLLPTLSYVNIGKRWLTQSDRPSHSTPPDTVDVNDMVTIARPGLYHVTVHVEINLTEATGAESHRTITIRVIDTPQARAKRRARIAFAAQTLRDANASAEAKSKAVRNLAYNNETEALPVLLDAYTSSSDVIREAAYEPLTLWHKPQDAYDAAHTRMKSLVRDKKPVRKSDWENLLGSWECLGAGSELCPEIVRQK